MGFVTCRLDSGARAQNCRPTSACARRIFSVAFSGVDRTSAENIRRGVIYGDANDHNVLVSAAWPQPRRVAGVIDFGDMHHGWIASEAAIATAYAILRKNDPLAAAKEIVRGFHHAYQLNEAEIE